jgi:hypothetical protein
MLHEGLFDGDLYFADHMRHCYLTLKSDEWQNG